MHDNLVFESNRQMVSIRDGMWIMHEKHASQTLFHSKYLSTWLLDENFRLSRTGFRLLQGPCYHSEWAPSLDLILRKFDGDLQDDVMHWHLREYVNGVGAYLVNQSNVKRLLWNTSLGRRTHWNPSHMPQQPWTPNLRHVFDNISDQFCIMRLWFVWCLQVVMSSTPDIKIHFPCQCFGYLSFFICYIYSHCAIGCRMMGS